MKDSKFIELLNLYIDHQISPEDAALLEAEIQQKPERRRIYRQYCQMQKACVVLAENFRSEAPDNDKVVEMSPAPRRMALVTYAMGVAAAAACVALVVVNRPVAKQGLTLVPTAIAEELLTSNEAVAAVEASPVSKTARPALHPAFAGMKRDEPTVDAAVATATHVPLDWMHQIQVERVSAENLWFNTRPTLQAQDLTLRSTQSFAQPHEGQVETTAFIFAK
jgi:anti-sigma factor RsiW